MGTLSPGNGTGSASPHTGDSPDRYHGLRRALCLRAQPDQPTVMKITETAILTHISWTSGRWAGSCDWPVKSPLAGNVSLLDCSREKLVWDCGLLPHCRDNNSGLQSEAFMGLALAMVPSCRAPSACAHTHTHTHTHMPTLSVQEKYTVAGWIHKDFSLAA